MKHLFGLCLLLIYSVASLFSMNIGEWQLYLTRNSISETEMAKEGSVCYVLASGVLMRYDVQTESVKVYERGNPLIDNNIAHIAWCEEAQRLLVVYESGNLDILTLDDKVYNLPDYYNKAMTEDKTVKGTVVQGKSVYLVTGFCIIEVDMERVMISSTHALDSEVALWAMEQPYFRNNAPQLPATITGGGPNNNNFASGIVVNGRLYATAGHYNRRQQERSNHGGVQIFDEHTEEWSMLDESFVSSLGHRYQANNQVAVDPRDDQHIFVSGRTGLYEFECDTFVAHYNRLNSPIQSATTVNGSLNYCIVQGMVFDAEGNLWLTNSITDNSHLYCLKARDNYAEPARWDSLNLRAGTVPEGLSAQCIDSRGYLWCVNTFWKGDCYAVCCDIKRGGMQFFESYTNQNGSTFGQLTRWHCLAEDLEGNMWMGTSNGPVYFRPEQIYSGEQTLNQYVVPRNDGSGLGDYLLAGVNILCIRVDVMGRKWFGTNDNGVYVVSRDNNTQIAHFTTDNSMLPSNEINDIYIDPTTGKVYFFTFKGLAVYQSDANQGAETNHGIYCYPNPVRPDYTGGLTICDLQGGSTVVITDAGGNVVHRAQSLSGTYQWNLQTESGMRLKPGVYVVYSIDEDGKDGGKTRFLVL